MSRCWLFLLAVLAAGVAWSAYDASPPPSPLLRAAFKGDIAYLRSMLPLEDLSRDGGLRAHVQREVSARDRWNNSALHWACRGGSRDALAVATHLIRAGAEVRAKNAGGSEAMHWAAAAAGDSSTQLIALLVSHGADVRAPNGALETPLHWSVDWVRPQAVDQLLTLGAEVNAMDQEGNTALHKIKRTCHEQEDCTALVARLLKGGADASLKNRYGRTALQYFNQDVEQQNALRKQQAEEQVRSAHEDAASEPVVRVTVDSTGDASAADATVTPPVQRMSAEQIEQIQSDFEEFKKNMTADGLLDSQRTAGAESDQAATDQVA